MAGPTKRKEAWQLYVHLVEGFHAGFMRRALDSVAGMPLFVFESYGVDYSRTSVLNGKFRTRVRYRKS